MSAAQFPPFYRAVFLWLEPLSILTGAVYAHFAQHLYLTLTHPPTAPTSPISLPISTSIVLTQLANLYLGLALLEASLLRVSADIKVWKTLIIILLVADLGHLYSVHLVGTWVYWQFWRWNAIDWGNVGVVYFLALTRLSMLSGIGFSKQGNKKA